MNSPSHQPASSSRKGIAAVEFALIAPVFMVLVLGIAEMGRAVQTATVMGSAIREGGRLAFMDWSQVVPEDADVNAKVISDIRNFMFASGLPADEIDISIVHADGENEGATFNLADPDNYLKYCRIEATVDFAEVSTMPYKFMVGRTIDSDYVFRVGRITQLVE